MILPAQEIRKMKWIITPFYERSKANGMSYGLSSAGYDVRVAQGFTMWPGRFKLASTLEFFSIPFFLLATVADKSTWARRGLAVQNTVLEPGWRGFLTLEISNHSWNFIRVRKGDPIAQIIFHQLTSDTCQPYDGKYQDQQFGPVAAKYE